MESLPDLAIINVAKYLSPRDLIACSTVCRKWREKFNVNLAWKPHLLFPENYYTIQEKYKEMIFCRPYNEPLQPLCSAREHYIRDQCLRFNCSAGLFTVEAVKPITPETFTILDNNIDKEGNYWLFINTIQAIEVWNITNKPYFQSRAFKRVSDPTCNLYILDTKVILVTYNFVQVFCFEHPKYQLELQNYFFFDQESPVVNLQDVIGPGGCQLNTKHIVSGNILIGYPTTVPKVDITAMNMHIWNLETMVKLATMSIAHERMMSCFLREDPKGVVRFNMYNGDSERIVIVLSENYENNTACWILVFNVKELKFLNFMKRTTEVLILNCSVINDYIAIYGFTNRPGFFISLVNLADVDLLSTKVLTKLGVNCNSQFLFGSPKTYIKTSNDVHSVELELERIIITQVLKDEGLKDSLIRVISPFIFTINPEGEIKMWDMKHKHAIKELSVCTGNLDIRRAISLKDVEFSPKIICTDVDNSIIHILSFW